MLCSDEKRITSLTSEPHLTPQGSDVDSCKPEAGVSNSPGPEQFAIAEATVPRKGTQGSLL